jgi:Sulfotransferase domain
MIKPRIVQVGFNRAGTSSIADFLRRAGFKVVDHTFDAGHYKGKNLALHIEANVNAGRAPLAGLEQWNAFTDIEYVHVEKTFYGQNWFAKIAEAHPETKFILNIRDKNSWLESRKKFGGYLETSATAAGVSQAEILEIWSAEWDQHIAAVSAYFSKDRLFILDIDKPDEAGLNAFVGSTKKLALRQKNKAPRGFFSKALNKFSTPALAKLFPQSFRNWVKNF